MLAPGGTLLVLLYSYWDLYHITYKLLLPLRKYTSPDIIPKFVLKMLVPVFNLMIGWSFTTEGVKNFLGDQFWTPHASFHKASEICKWGEEEQLELIKRKKTGSLGICSCYTF